MKPKHRLLLHFVGLKKLAAGFLGFLPYMATHWEQNCTTVCEVCTNIKIKSKQFGVSLPGKIRPQKLELVCTDLFSFGVCFSKTHAKSIAGVFLKVLTDDC